MSRCGRTTRRASTSTRSTRTGCGSPAPARCSAACARPPTRRSCRRATSASSRRRRCTPTPRSPRPRTRFADGYVATVQNGLGNEETLARHVERVIRGTTFPAGKILEPGHVQWDVKGDTTLGPFEPSRRRSRRCERLADACTRGGMPTTRRRRRARPAVAQGDLQRLDEPDRRAHRPDARPRVRAARPARARLRPRRRGQGGRRGAGHRARRRSRGADRPRGEAGGRVRPQGVDAAGRRGATQRRRSTI